MKAHTPLYAEDSVTLLGLRTSISMARMRSLFFLCLLGTGALSSEAAPSTLATVNGYEITSKEAEALLSREDLQSDSAVERLILFRLAVEAAKAEGLDQNPAVKLETEKVLYKSFLEKKAKAAGSSLAVSERELETAYGKEPLVRLRHLFLPAEKEAEKKRARQLLTRLKKNAQKGTPFKSLVLKHSKDVSRSWGGDTDFKGVNSFPPLFYQEALRIRKGQISDILETKDGLHLFQLIDRKPFSEATPMYLAFLRSKEKTRKETAFLMDALTDLKKNAKIELPPSRSQSE